jgi:hypothetical protein
MLPWGEANLSKLLICRTPSIALSGRRNGSVCSIAQTCRAARRRLLCIHSDDVLATARCDQEAVSPQLTRYCAALGNGAPDGLVRHVANATKLSDDSKSKGAPANGSGLRYVHLSEHPRWSERCLNSETGSVVPDGRNKEAALASPAARGTENHRFGVAPPVSSYGNFLASRDTFAAASVESLVEALRVPHP